MKRSREKGKNLIAFPEKYTVIDIETTGLDPGFDSIIEVAAIKYENGNEVGRFNELVKPSSYFVLDEEDLEAEQDYVIVDGSPAQYVGNFITALTGITNAMLDEARDEAIVLAEYLNFIGKDILVGHNINFDINFLYDAAEESLDVVFDNDFVDNMRIARKHLNQLNHHRQADIVEYYDIPCTNAHRALADCIMCNECHERLREEIINGYGSVEAFADLFKRKYRSGGGYKLRAKDITANTSDIDPDNALYNKVFVFTGTLDKMPRKEAMQIVADFGGINGDSVTKKTNYLVLGTQDYRVTKGGKSSKMKKAEKLQLEGQDIQIISENVFYDMVNEEMQFAENGDFTSINTANDDWKNEVRNMLTLLAEKLELPKGSLSLLGNIGRLSDEETSYSVNIYEPEYPEIPNAKRDETRNSIVLRIEEKHLKSTNEDVLDVLVGKAQYNYLPKPNVIKTTERQSEPDFIRLRFDVKSDELVDYIKANTEYRVKNYSSKEAMFGCCSRYEQCSDAKQCVHPNKLFACACQYKHNLESGRIFYGKNKNVDEHGKLIGS